jgi:tetratricopeptide (TPR) repeat protein
MKFEMKLISEISDGCCLRCRNHEKLGGSMMFTKHRLIMGIAMILIIVVSVSCGGPEQKKAKFYNKGKALYEKGELVKAKLEFKNAIQIDPKYADAYYMLGMVALKSGDYRGAYRDLLQSCRTIPSTLGRSDTIGQVSAGCRKDR